MSVTTVAIRFSSRAAAAIGLWIALIAAAPPLSFIPASPDHGAAADEYRRIWEEEGPRIVTAMEQATGLVFPDTPIEVIITSGPPMTSFDGRTIRLRAGYTPDYKKAALIHELGHRLALTLPRTAETDDHRLLNLFLYDVLTDLYGFTYASQIVSIERRIPGTYDYDAAWSWALGLTREERQERLRTIRMTADNAAGPKELGGRDAGERLESSL